MPDATTGPADQAIRHIPVIDIADLSSDRPDARRAVARRICDAAETVGFLYVSGHGIPPERFERLFAETRRFFALPREAKERLSLRHSHSRRGYLAELEENFNRHLDTVGDLKEGISIGIDLPDDDPDVVARKPLHGGNMWPDDLPGWREFINLYMDDMLGLGRRLMRGFALGLGLDERYFEPMLAKPISNLRLLHYPPQAVRPLAANQRGCGEHCDYGCLTMLVQDEIGGLEVQTRAGEWLPATPIPGTVVVNIGDMLMRWSNDRFRSTPHRVTNPMQVDRYSAGVFFHPSFDTLLECLPGCHDAANPPRYAPKTAGAHFVERLNAAYPPL